jgi:GTPase SAR1 family protein
MSDDLNYPYLLAVHTLCVDGQLHQNELQFLQLFTQSFEINESTQAAAEAILAQADEHIDLEIVLQRIPPDQRLHALSMVALASRFDGFVDQTEQRLLEKIQKIWRINDEDYEQIQDFAQKESQRLISEKKAESQEQLSTGAKMLRGIEAAFGQEIVNRVVGTIGTESLKERVQDYRVEALLSGPKYDKVIDECREVGLRDIEVADKCLNATADALREIGQELGSMITDIEAQIGDKPANAAREAIRSMKEDSARINLFINQELQDLRELQAKKRRAMNFYTIAFMGRSKAGKSTLHAVVTGGGWDQIGVGRQNTTRLNRVYEWHNIRIIDTPGIATPGGDDLQTVAESIIDEADLICFVVTNNNQQASEFEFLKQLRNKGKPLLVLLNVKQGIDNPVKLKRFLAQPDKAFSDDKDRLGGHLDRIRRDAKEHYGTSQFPIIPVDLLAAQIAQQQPEHEHSQALMKASRLQHFLDSVRLSLLEEGLLRRSQNLLGSTVTDIERPCHELKTRSEFYLSFAQQISGRSKESAQRLKKAQDDHARQLEQDIRSIFAELQRQVPDFAEDHWDTKQENLNGAWGEEIRRFGLEKKIYNSQERAIQAFTTDITDLLDEIGRELALSRHVVFKSVTLNEQDSSTWAAQTSKWGGGLLGVVGAVLLLNSNPFGWAITGVSIALGLLSSLLESKASKRRKAVANISTALHTQIEKQEKQIVESTLKHFRDLCSQGTADVQDYFRLSSDGLSFVGQALAQATARLQAQGNVLNTHFAARILDFASSRPSESSAAALREQIRDVRRKVGEQIDIAVCPSMRTTNDLSAIESVIQEKIILQKVGT